MQRAVDAIPGRAPRQEEEWSHAEAQEGASIGNAGPAQKGAVRRPHAAEVARGRGSTESGKTLLHPALRGAFLHEVEAATDIPRRAGS